MTKVQDKVEMNSGRNTETQKKATPVKDAPKPASGQPGAGAAKKGSK